MNVEQVVRGIEGFTTWPHARRIRVLAWYIHRHEQRDRFTVADLRRLSNDLSLAHPGNYSQQVADLERSGVIVKDGANGGFYLERRARDELDAQLGHRPTRIAVQSLLASLAERVPNLRERAFLTEAVLCFDVGAFRAAIVMTWNLAFDHLCTFVLTHHRAAFNRQWPVTYAKRHKDAAVKEVNKPDDFSEMKESEVIQVCKSAGIIPDNVAKILSEKLTRRNIAAHPSSVIIEAVQAEDFILDLVNNVVLKLVRA
jgi:hypothetical protein